MKCLFKKKKPVYESHGEKPSGSVSATIKWGIIIPHVKKAGGADTPDGKIDEYDYGLKMVDKLDMPYETRDSGGVKGAAKRLKKRGVTASLEPHKNAYNGKAEGFEILVLASDSLSIEFAELIAEAFAKKFPDRKIRGRGGLKKLKKGDRGAGNLIAAKKAGMKVALLSEAFFIDNPAEWIEPDVMAKFWTENLIDG